MTSIKELMKMILCANGHKTFFKDWATINSPELTLRPWVLSQCKNSLLVSSSLCICQHKAAFNWFLNGITQMCCAFIAACMEVKGEVTVWVERSWLQKCCLKESAYFNFHVCDLTCIYCTGVSWLRLYGFSVNSKSPDLLQLLTIAIVPLDGHRLDSDANRSPEHLYETLIGLIKLLYLTVAKQWE